MISNTITKIFDKYEELFKKKERKITFLTGAGISAESGIPTYRGVEGYWTKGSRNYKPEEIGTYKFYQQYPKEVWQFALYRRSVCLKAQPNKGHLAITEIETILEDQFHLITQNVDRLHHRAGTSLERTFEIHGNIDQVRCSTVWCDNDLLNFPGEIGLKEIDETIPEEDWNKLKCPHCKMLLRPFVLWFDETYDEKYYRLNSTLRVAKETGILFIVGTSGATNLPQQVVQQTLKSNGIIVDINTERGKFTELAESKKNGFVINGSSNEVLPLIAEEIQKRF